MRGAVFVDQVQGQPWVQGQAWVRGAVFVDQVQGQPWMQGQGGWRGLAVLALVLPLPTPTPPRHCSQAPLQWLTADWKAGSTGCYDVASLTRLQVRLETGGEVGWVGGRVGWGMVGVVGGGWGGVGGGNGGGTASLTRQQVRLETGGLGGEMGWVLMGRPPSPHGGGTADMTGLETWGEGGSGGGTSAGGADVEGGRALTGPFHCPMLAQSVCLHPPAVTP